MFLRRFPFVAFATLALAASSAGASTFTVSNYNDAGPGSLRQAILDANAAPGADVIAVTITGPGPYVIKPQGKLLPPIVGPAILRGAMRAGAPVVVLDGSGIFPVRTPTACPGATATYDAQNQQWQYSRVSGTGPNVRGYWGAGLTVIDSHDVEISGLEIRNFCIGVAAVRSNGVNVHDMKIVDAHGAAGVIFTGDNGEAVSTPLSFNNRLLNSVLLDNGDGFEFTRGTHDSFLENNTISLTRPLPANGNAVEYASSGPRNSMIGNTFTKYVSTAVTVGSGGEHTIRGNKIIGNATTGMSVAGNNNTIVGNTFTDNGGIGITIGGTGSKVTNNVVSNNGGVGVSVTGNATTLSKNSIFGNKGLAIDLAPPGANVIDGASACADALPDCDTGANGSQNPPSIEASTRWTAQGVTVQGSLMSRPNTTYTIELFASRAAAAGITAPPPDGGRAGAAVPEEDAVAGAASSPAARGGAAGAGGGGRGAPASPPAGGVELPAPPPAAAEAPPPGLRNAAADAVPAGRGGGRGGGRGAAVDTAPATATATSTPTGDGEKFLGTVSATTDAKGLGTFKLMVPGANPLGKGVTTIYLAGTATDSAGNTSEYGPALSLSLSRN